METELKLLKLIYLYAGIYVRELSRKLEIGIPSVKYGLDKLISKKLIMAKKEGRNLKFFINYGNNLIIPYLYSIEYSRIMDLPLRIRESIFDFLGALKYKPTITLVFGSYASGKYSKDSDVDILLVFNKISEDIEEKSRIIGGRYSIKLEPVYITLEDFNKKFFDKKDRFMKQVKENRILVNGIEWWVLLENETA